MKTRPSLIPLLALLATACTVKNDASVEIYAVCAPPDDAEKCSTSEKCDLTWSDRPWAMTRYEDFDGTSGLRSRLRVFIQVNNQLPNNADASAFRLNTNDVTLEEFRLSFDTNPPFDLPDFTYQANQAVPANGSSVPLVTLIPPERMEMIEDAILLAGSTAIPYNGATPQARVDVTIVALGRKKDGSEIETGPFVVPVDVFLAEYVPTCAKVTEIPAYACPNLGQAASHKCITP